MLVLGGVHVGAQLVGGGPQGLLQILQGAAGGIHRRFAAPLLFRRLGFGSGSAFAGCQTRPGLIKCLLGEAVGRRFATL
ncbi:hypothetical protein D3C76_717050 [compost metagenome]